MNEIAALPEARRIYAERWVSFVTKRAPNPSDACIVDSLAENLSDDAYPLQDVVLDVSQMPSFNQRTRAAE